MDNKHKITHEGELDLAGLKIPCYVLEDGTRVLSGGAMQDALKLEDEDTKYKSGSRLARYLSQKSLKPFIYKDKTEGHFKPLECYKGKAKINGYDATILADICEGFLEARKNIKLSPRQKIIAEQCEILIRGFARIGIVALVDEATGYQYDREKKELQKLLKAYISEGLLPWQKRFPDIFYQELFRLNGWNYTLKGIKKRPSVIGRWTNTLVYKELPEGILEELQNKTPKSTKGNKTARYHQSLTLDIGEPHLTAQINKIITLFQLSDNMEDMWKQFTRIQKNPPPEQLEFDFDEKGHTIEPKEKEKLSSFNKNLKTALEYNPSE